MILPLGGLFYVELLELGAVSALGMNSKEDSMPQFLSRIESLSPLLMHRFDEQAEVEEATRKVNRKKRVPRQEAERAAYRDREGFLYLPGSAIGRMLREAGGGHKQRSSRKSIKYVVPAAILVLEETLPLLERGSNKRLRDFEVDSRPVVIPSTKGRIMRHRPRLEEWAIEFHLEVDEEVLDTDLVHQLLEEGTRKLGLGDFRPEKGGPFGRAIITRWQEIGEQKPKLVAKG